MSGLPPLYGVRQARTPAIDRNQIYRALYDRLKNAAPFLTTATRLIPWTQVGDQPALFLRTGPKNDWLERQGRAPPRVVLEAEIWIYARGSEDPNDPDAAPSMRLNPLIGAVEAALDPYPLEAQTLGGLVAHCWLEGEGAIESGDLSGQAIACLPVKMLVPGVSPTGLPI
jgi:hypothetical protein